MVSVLKFATVKKSVTTFVNLSHFATIENNREISAILPAIFQPGFGASLQMLKVEIGGDAQSTGEWKFGINRLIHVECFKD